MHFQRRVVAMSALAGVPALALGCGDELPDEVVRKMIGPGGGLVSSHDGVLTLNILPGLLDEDVTIEIFPSDAPPLVFGPAYRVKPNIELPFELEVTYRRVLPSDPEHVAVAAIHLADYTAEAGEWTPLRTIELDIEKDLVTGLDREIALYYALVDDAEDIAGSTTTDESSDSDGSTSTGEDSEDASTTGEESGDTVTFPDLSHATDIQPIWDAHCLTAGCHDVQSPVLTGDAYASLVGASSLSATVPFVTEGNLERSYLWFKLTDIAACGCQGMGSRMPLIGGPLDEDTLARIEAWILQGAAP